MRRVAAVARNAFRESVRERVLYNLLFFAVIMTVSGLLLGELSIRQDAKIIKDLGLAAMDLFGTLIALFVGVGLVSKEIERRSLHPLLAKPVSRDEFLLGKFAGLGFTLLVNVGLMTAGLYATLLALGRGADPALLKAVFAIYLALLVTVALALLLSIVTSTAVASVSTLCLVIAGRYSDVILNLGDVMPGAPSWALRAVMILIPNFRNFDLKDRVVYGDPVSFVDIGWITAYAVAYTGTVITLAVIAFRRRELT
jgi:ABC-type transport system involved in multi-copper enzyme maturation permease subunit